MNLMTRQNLGWEQEYTESTHEDEEIPILKYACCAAFEEDCSPAGSPRPSLSKLLGNLSGLDTCFSASYVAVHAKLAKNAHYAI